MARRTRMPVTLPINDNVRYRDCKRSSGSRISDGTNGISIVKETITIRCEDVYARYIG